MLEFSEECPTVILSFDQRVRTASAVIGIRIGSKHEFPGTFGLAHLLEHMIFRGTVRHPSQEDFVLPFVKLGAKFNGETGRDRTMYYVTSLPEEFPKAIALLVEMIKQPLFDKNKMAVEKQAVLNELKTSKSEPSAYLQNELLLPNVLKHFFPRYHGPMGLAEDVERATYRDLLELYRSAYTVPSRIVISLHGHLPMAPKDMLRLVQETWRSIPYSMPPVPYPEQKHRKEVLNQKLELYAQRMHGPLFPMARRPHLAECYVGMAWISGPLESFDAYVLNWISAYLTGDLISCLYHELRVKRGLVYQILSGQYGLVNTGVFSIKWQTRHCKNIPLTVEIIRKQLDDLKKFNDENALQMWKRWIITRFTMEQDRSINTAKLYAQQMLLAGRIRSLQSICKFTESLTCHDIRDVSKRVFDRPVTIAMLENGK